MAEKSLGSGLSPTLRPCPLHKCCALPCPHCWMSPPHPQASWHTVGTSERWLGEGGPPLTPRVPAHVSMAVSLTRPPRTRSSLRLLTHSRSGSARTRSSCWCGWWMSSGECSALQTGGGVGRSPAGLGHHGAPAGPHTSLLRSGPPGTFRLLLPSTCPQPWTELAPACFNMTLGKMTCRLRPAPARSVLSSWGPSAPHVTHLVRSGRALSHQQRWMLLPPSSAPVRPDAVPSMSVHPAGPSPGGRRKPPRPCPQGVALLLGDRLSQRPQAAAPQAWRSVRGRARVSYARLA